MAYFPEITNVGPKIIT